VHLSFHSEQTTLEKRNTVNQRTFVSLSNFGVSKSFFCVLNSIKILFYILWPPVRRLHPEKIGFWVWVLGWVLYPNPNPKPKNFYTQTQNLNPKPKNFYTLTPNPNPKIWVQCMGTNICHQSPHTVSFS
jgi:hypothetical protein